MQSANDARGVRLSHRDQTQHLPPKAHSAFVTMTRAINGVPAPFRHRVYNLRSRKHSRPFGYYVELAEACLASGAPIRDVLAPLWAIQEHLLKHAQSLGRLPGQYEALSAEQHANYEADEAERAFLRLQTPENREQLVDAWENQGIATTLAITAVLSSHS